jgi:hypothetical protein
LKYWKSGTVYFGRFGPFQIERKSCQQLGKGWVEVLSLLPPRKLFLEHWISLDLTGVVAE